MLAKIQKNGTLMVLLAAILWSTSGLCIKLLPWSSLTITALRSLIGAATLFALGVRPKKRPSLTTMLSSICMTAMLVTFLTANKMTTASNAIVLQYTAPVFIIIASAVFLKQKPRVLELATVLVSLAGIALCCLDHLGEGALRGDAIALLSGVAFGGVFFFNGMPTTSPAEASLWGCLLTSVVAFPFVFFDTAFAQTKGDIRLWGVIFFSGAVHLGVAYLVFSMGMLKVPAVTASIVSSIEPILNPIWVFLVLREAPSAQAIAGGAIVILAITCYSIINIRIKASQPAG